MIKLKKAVSQIQHLKVLLKITIYGLRIGLFYSIINVYVLCFSERKDNLNMWRGYGDGSKAAQLTLLSWNLFCSSPNRGIPVQESDGNGNHFQSSSAEHRSTETHRTCEFHYSSGASAPRKQMVGDSCATCRN